MTQHPVLDNRLSIRDIEAADAAVAALNALEKDGGPLSKEAMAVMASGGYEVSFELSIRKTGVRLAVDMVGAGEYDTALSIVSSIAEDPSLAHVGWETGSDVGADAAQEEGRDEDGPNTDDNVAGDAGDGEAQELDPEPEREPEQEREREPEPEEDQDPEAMEEAAEPEPAGRPAGGKGRRGKPVSSSAAFGMAPARTRADGAEIIRRVAMRMGIASPGPVGPSGSGDPSRQPSRKAQKAMGQEPMERYVSEYVSAHGVSEERSVASRYVGSDYLLDGKAVSLHKLFSDGSCVVGVKGTRYYRAAHVSSLSDMYPARALPKYLVGDPSAGMTVFVGLGEKGDKTARSFRQAKVAKVRKNGTVDVLFADSGTTGTCRPDQLSSKPLRK